MESIGEKLRSARLERNISIEQAARDTHIAKHYIDHLETESFDRFPGETYLIGFLRTYARYLELSDDELVTLYRNIKIQEQPAPIDELLNTNPNRKTIVRAGILILALVLVGVAVVLLLGERGALFAGGDSVVGQPVVEEALPPAVRLNEEFVERRFVQGERILVPVGDTEAVLEFVTIGDDVSIGAAGQVNRVRVGTDTPVDLTADGLFDVRVAVRSVSTETNPPTVVARIDRVVQSPSSTFSVDLTDDGAGGIHGGESRIIARFEQPEEYFVEADFRGYTMFRYQIDDREQRERFFQRGDRVRDSVRDDIRLWASNAGNIRLRIAGIPVELGDDGEVIAIRVAWLVEDDGAYTLILSPLD